MGGFKSTNFNWKSTIFFKVGITCPRKTPKTDPYTLVLEYPEEDKSSLNLIYLHHL